MTLIYSGSVHGWMAKDFHSRCDNKGPTISLFKIKNGDCIGGYTAASWGRNYGNSSQLAYGSNIFAYDSSAMLFNLSRQRKFANTK